MAATAALRAREGTPPPVIAKAGRYTVFLTPPPTPTPSEAPQTSKSPLSNPKTPQSPNLSPPLPPKPAPLVQVPPPQFEESKGPKSIGAFGFFWDAVAKVQDVHSSLDGFLAEWFGLDQSKYQWALNDYYESKAEDKECVKKEVAKEQNV